MSSLKVFILLLIFAAGAAAIWVAGVRCRTRPMCSRRGCTSGRRWGVCAGADFVMDGGYGWPVDGTTQPGLSAVTAAFGRGQASRSGQRRLAAQDVNFVIGVRAPVWLDR